MGNAIDTLLRLLDLFEAGTITYNQVQAIREKVEAMKAAARDPSPEEWAALFADIDADTAALDAEAKRLNP